MQQTLTSWRESNQSLTSACYTPLSPAKEKWLTLWSGSMVARTFPRFSYRRFRIFGQLDSKKETL